MKKQTQPKSQPRLQPKNNIRYSILVTIEGEACDPELLEIVSESLDRAQEYGLASIVNVELYD
jgi:hypothetical protein